jgi:T5SS/PEP-CTERM-associated repeat protein
MRKSLITFWSAVLITLFTCLGSASLHAESNTFTVIDGTSTNANGPYSVGNNGPSNTLIITNAGVLLSTLGTVGFTASASLNYGLVTGAGSKWIMSSNFYVGLNGFSNRMVIENGGCVSNLVAVLGSSAGSNSVSVSDKGSELISGVAFYLGANSSGNQLLITNGGHFQSVTSVISGTLTVVQGGLQPSGNANKVVVSGEGSRWDNSSFVILGQTGHSNQIVLQNGGMGVWSSLGYGYQSFDPTTYQNSLLLLGGKLFVTNATHTGVISMGENTQSLLITNGLLVVDTFKNSGGIVSFASGTMTARVMINALPFTIGNGKLPAILTLLSNNHSFTGGLSIATNAMLQAEGTIQGSITSSGLLALEDSPSKLTVRGSFTQKPAGSLSLRIGGLSQGTQYDFITVTNLADLSGTLHLSLVNGFIPNPNDVFTVMQFGSQSGAFANVPAGERLKTADNLCSFQVDYSGTTMQLSHYESTDLDGDGIEDAWATQYFGHSPLTPEEKGADLDGDGASNYSEFLAGTNPTDAASLFRLTAKQVGGNAVIEFGATSGVRYQLEYSDDLITWNRIATPLLKSSIPGISQWVDDGLQTRSLPPSAGRFYRANVE